MKLKLEHLKDEILQRYADGESASSIAKSLGEYLQPVTTLIKKYTEVKSLRPAQGNTRYFSRIDTHCKAYLLGFIAADGCIQNVKNSVGLTITIHIRDRIVLDILRQEIGNEHPLTLVKGGAHIRFALYNEQLVSDLANLGIHPRKSLSLGNFLMHVPVEFRKSAILGYFDGDGSVTISKNGTCYVQIRATESLIAGIAEELSIDRYYVNNSDSIPNMAFGAKRNIERFFTIYQHCPIFLDRKHEKFLVALG